MVRDDTLQGGEGGKHATGKGKGRSGRKNWLFDVIRRKGEGPVVRAIEKRKEGRWALDVRQKEGKKKEE